MKSATFFVLGAVAAAMLASFYGCSFTEKSPISGEQLTALQLREELRQFEERSRADDEAVKRKAADELSAELGDVSVELAKLDSRNAEEVAKLQARFAKREKELAAGLVETTKKNANDRQAMRSKIEAAAGRAEHREAVVGALYGQVQQSGVANQVPMGGAILGMIGTVLGIGGAAYGRGKAAEVQAAKEKVATAIEDVKAVEEDFRSVVTGLELARAKSKEFKDFFSDEVVGKTLLKQYTPGARAFIETKAAA